ncbi:hypothetical protein PTRA_a1368 [Pseudoalteromonas translucida KMM 520]|uniref:Uncharacterized protein n=1 Tax=Pseudoalteromonas translucida KMM 520 TaxID=1315283 RepID=A0A0U2X5K2_9GAMM|nr:hypothetical protein PTRA_a1368 [Pseudoalteromonas translucida KMM 520]
MQTLMLHRFALKGVGLRELVRAVYSFAKQIKLRAIEQVI